MVIPIREDSKVREWRDKHVENGIPILLGACNQKENKTLHRNFHWNGQIACVILELNLKQLQFFALNFKIFLKGGIDMPFLMVIDERVHDGTYQSLAVHGWELL